MSLVRNDLPQDLTVSGLEASGTQSVPTGRLCERWRGRGVIERLCDKDGSSRYRNTGGNGG
jgi:hypothetical protein